eukprot:CAMPEP_0113908330 /NCGR_PEP_ID=MMETSP0780_2-20120614/26091_1 /TAXON_ID=652834 /ORGANISM="Palpitomonas bilix" /LENGTH=1003 /DNA_ID=CAMNT_0000903725 /DNA_START=410 /DNA_END=3418 /DNA_ORIENTATION=- /assembly_acc=CAM_ASM_000599
MQILLDAWFGKHDASHTLRTLWKGQRENVVLEQMSVDDSAFIVEHMGNLTGEVDGVGQWKIRDRMQQLDDQQEDTSLFMGLLLAHQREERRWTNTREESDFFFCLLSCLIAPYLDHTWLLILEAFGCFPLVYDLLHLFSPFSRMWELLPITREQYQYRKYTGKWFPSYPIEASGPSYRFCSFMERIFCHYHECEADFVGKEKQLLRDFSFSATLKKKGSQDPSDLHLVQWSSIENRTLWTNDHTPSPFALWEELKRSRYEYSENRRSYPDVEESFQKFLLSPDQIQTSIGGKDHFLWGTVDLLCLSLATYHTNDSFKQLAFSFLFDPKCHRESYSMNGGSDTKYRMVKRDVLLSTVFTYFFRNSRLFVYPLIRKEMWDRANDAARSWAYQRWSWKALEQEESKWYQNTKNTLQRFVDFLTQHDMARIHNLLRGMFEEDPSPAYLDILSHHPFFQLHLDTSSRSAPSFWNRLMPESRYGAYHSFLIALFRDADRSPGHILVKLQTFVPGELSDAALKSFAMEIVEQSDVISKSNSCKLLVKWREMIPLVKEATLGIFFKTYLFCDYHSAPKKEISLHFLFKLLDIFIQDDDACDARLSIVLHSLHRAVTATEEERTRTWHPELIRALFVLLFYLLQRGPFQVLASALFGGSLHCQEHRDVPMQEVLRRLCGEKEVVKELLLWVPLYFGFPRDLLFLMDTLAFRRMILPAQTPNFLRDRTQVMMFLIDRDANTEGRQSFRSSAPDVFVKHSEEAKDFIYYRDESVGDLNEKELQKEFRSKWRRKYAVCSGFDHFMTTLYHFQYLRHRLVERKRTAAKRDPPFCPSRTIEHVVSGTGRLTWEQELVRRAHEEGKPLSEVRKRDLIKRSKLCCIRREQPRLGEWTILCPNLHVITLRPFLDDILIHDGVRNAFEALPSEHIYSLAAFQRIEADFKKHVTLETWSCPLCSASLGGTFFWFEFDPRYYGSNDPEEAKDISPWTEANSEFTKSPIILGTYERRNAQDSVW